MKVCPDRPQILFLVTKRYQDHLVVKYALKAKNQGANSTEQNAPHISVFLHKFQFIILYSIFYNVKSYSNFHLIMKGQKIVQNFRGNSHPFDSMVYGHQGQTPNGRAMALVALVKFKSKIKTRPRFILFLDS